MAIHDNPEAVWSLTIKPNTVAIVTDGTAVLGLGDIGPEAAMPVMEGKALLFKEFGGVDGFPVCVNARTPDEVVDLVARAFAALRKALVAAASTISQTSSPSRRQMSRSSRFRIC